MPIATVFIQNEYDGLFTCFDDIYSCVIGFCFPYCLFGSIYEKAQFGTCLTGCGKMFSIYFILGVLFMVSHIQMEYNILLSKENKYLSPIDDCSLDEDCHINIDEQLKTYNDNCLPTNNTQVCECLIKPYKKYCEFNKNELPQIIDLMIYYTSMINLLHLFLGGLSMGVFSGYYRRKISYKLDINENTWKSFWIHCCPLTHLLALCQEYKSLEKYNKLITPISVENIQTRLNQNFMV